MRAEDKPSEIYYLYGLTKPEVLATRVKKALRGMDGTGVNFMKINNIVAVYGKLPAHEYSAGAIERKVKDINWLEEKIGEHYSVQEIIMKRQLAIIPFKFCTIFKTGNRIKDFITQNQAGIKNLLCRLEGKQEWSVKIFRNKELLKKNLLKLEPGIGEKFKEMESCSGGKAFLMKKKFLQDIDSIVSRISTSQTHELIEILKGISVDARQNETFSSDDVKDEEMIANFSFLIETKDVEKLISEVDKFTRRYSGGGLAARYSGPWLPYNFASLPGVDQLE
ncbi:MAG TPA: GvpL/GvpF family gas vesicle protein [Bacillota bacterium]|nr:GvpL/GvpF family gas vesicle protein [Bacillota bacterium]